MNMELITRFESSLATGVSNSSRFWSHLLRQLNEVKLLSQDSASVIGLWPLTSVFTSCHLLPMLQPYGAALARGTLCPANLWSFHMLFLLPKCSRNLPSLFNPCSSSQSQIKSQTHPLGWLL